MSGNTGNGFSFQEFRYLFASISAVWATIRLTALIRNYRAFIRIVLPEGKGSIGHRLFRRVALRIFLCAIMDPGLGVLLGMYVGFWILGWN